MGKKKISSREKEASSGEGKSWRDYQKKEKSNGGEKKNYMKITHEKYRKNISRLEKEVENKLNSKKKLFNELIEREEEGRPVPKKRMKKLKEEINRLKGRRERLEEF